MSAKINSLRTKIAGLKTAMDEMDQTVIERSAPFSDEEQATYDEMASQLERASEDLEKASKIEEKVQRSIELGAQLGGAPSGGQSGVKVVKEEKLYRQEGEHSFVQDMIARAKRTDDEALARLANWNQAERKDPLYRAAATSGDLAGLIIPQYLTNEVIELSKEGRPFLNVLRSRPVRGKSVIIPRVVTEPTTAAQATENTAFDTTALDTEEVTISTNTVGGYSDLSVQAVEWPDTVDESWLFQQMLDNLYDKMDYLALWGAGSGNEPEGLFFADNTNVIQGDALGNGSAADKFGELYGVVRQGAALIRQQEHRSATHVVMSAYRWHAISSALDSEGRPLLGWADSAPQNVGGTWTGPSFAGLPVVQDENAVKLTEDDTGMAIIHAPSLYFAESSPVQMRVDTVVAHTGGVRFIIRAYMAFSAELRPKATTLVEDLPLPEFPTEGGLS